MSLEIKEVQSAKELKAFVKFSLKLYKNNPYYVPALTFDEINTFNPKKNPAFDFCESTNFVAIRDGEIVGRVAAIFDRRAPLVDGAAGLRALELADRVNAGILEHAQRVKRGSFDLQDTR